MTRLTLLFLILLRLTIGWHFLFEGLEKLNSPGWTGEAYLREASGPLAPSFHKLAGDPVADRLTGTTAPPDAEKPDTKLDGFLPAKIEQDWDAWFRAYTQRYKLDADQRSKADKLLTENKNALARWILVDKTAIAKPSSYGPPVSESKTVREWVEHYQELVARARELEKSEARGTGGTSYEAEGYARLRAAKADSYRIRNALKGELTQRTNRMQDALIGLVTPEQFTAAGDMPRLVKPAPWKWSFLDWSDLMVAWGLTLVGGCLLLGLLTRQAAIAGALLLASFYLAMPPLPGLPENPKAEGHYFVINKNLIEMFALLFLASVNAGRWAGLDGVFRYLSVGTRLPVRLLSLVLLVVGLGGFVLPDLGNLASFVPLPASTLPLVWGGVATLGTVLLGASLAAERDTRKPATAAPAPVRSR